MLALALQVPNLALAQDTQAPTSPTSLAGTRISGTQVYLTWNASSDNVGVAQYRIERCTGASCTNFAQVTTSTVPSVTTSGIAATSAYRYRVRAQDAALNNSTYSNIATFGAVSGDATAPTAPTSNTASVVSSTAINLSWAGATDNVGVVAYIVQSCTGAGCTTFANLVTLTGATFSSSFSSTGLTAATTYRYRVRARDSNGNLGSFSPIATATTSGGADTTAPSAPGALTATASGTSQINLSWGSATDNVGVTGYKVERCQGTGCTTFAQIATPATISFSDTGLTTGTTYQYRVRANDAAGNNGPYSNTGSATTQGAADTTAPTAPGTLTATASGTSQVNLSWGPATDNVGVTGYKVERCQGAGCTSFLQIATPTTTTFGDTGLTAGTTYQYRVRANDAAGNSGAYSNTAPATTQSGGDTTAPSAPGTLSATAASTSQINLSWGAATDNVGVTGYKVERCQGTGCTGFAQIATPVGTTFNDTGLAAGTTYLYRVRANDAAGNNGAYSNTASAATQAGPDTQAPTVPTGLTVTPGTTQMSLSWGASTDNVGVTAYAVERCQGAGCTAFTQIAQLSGTTYLDTGLLANLPYGYRVRARDAAGNWSGYSGNGNGVMAECD